MCECCDSPRASSARYWASYVVESAMEKKDEVSRLLKSSSVENEDVRWVLEVAIDESELQIDREYALSVSAYYNSAWHLQEALDIIENL